MQRSRGFTLVEVMVALIIIAIGTLGIAKMQALALASTSASRSRALAAIEASSLAAAMHANRAYWGSSAATPGNITVTTATGTATTTSDSALMQTAVTTVAGTACPTSTTMQARLSCYCASGGSPPCASPYVNMAASDLYDWSWGLASLLPASTAKITCVNSNFPVNCTILIQWVENAVSVTQQNGAVAAAANGNTNAGNTAAFQFATYTLYVVP
jgi:type IV pilus assembly protein PilV